MFDAAPSPVGGMGKGECFFMVKLGTPETVAGRGFDSGSVKNCDEEIIVQDVECTVECGSLVAEAVIISQAGGPCNISVRLLINCQ